ncbi:MAG: sodium:solute symporter family protein [Alphaproteobacteria bacterium]|nr:sodium:solute symporter family protein [Alphaproteobacteria bacterium]
MQITIVSLYLLAVLVIGLWAGRGIKSMEEYATAGKSFGTLAIFATLSASFIGGGFSTGNAEKVFLIGIGNIVALWGFSLKEILVARFIAPRMERYPHAISVGDIMEPHYGKGARIFSGIFGVLLCAGILGAQVGAMGYVFNLFLGMDQLWGILIGCGIVIVYSTIGGMRSVVWTDFFQFVVLAVGVPLTLYFGIEAAGGWGAITQRVPASHLSLGNSPSAYITLGALFMAFFLGETLVPPYVQRLLIGKSSKQVMRGTILSGIFSIPFFAVTGLIGLVALAMEPTLNANLAMPYVIKNALPPLTQSFVIAGIISIIMSSADSFLNSASVAFSNDIVRPLLKKPLSKKKELHLAQAITLIVGLLAVLFAVSIESVLDILLYAYNFWAPTVLVPLALAILGANVSKRQFFAGASAGILATLIWNVGLNNPYHIDGLVIGALANLVTFYAAGFFEGKMVLASDID